MRIWETEGQSSVVSLSDSTYRGAEAVVASLTPILTKFVEKGVSFINVVSDSPMSQYRNKTIFWFMKTFGMTNNIKMRWIFLENGHGKGIPDGIGATVKRTIKEVMNSNPDIPIYNVKALLENGLQEMLPSIEVLTHGKEAIDAVKLSVPKKLYPAPNTLKVHEVSVTSFVILSYKFTSDKDETVFSLDIPNKRKYKKHSNVILF